MHARTHAPTRASWCWPCGSLSNLLLCFLEDVGKRIEALEKQNTELKDRECHALHLQMLISCYCLNSHPIVDTHSDTSLTLLPPPPLIQSSTSSRLSSRRPRSVSTRSRRLLPVGCVALRVVFLPLRVLPGFVHISPSCRACVCVDGHGPYESRSCPDAVHSCLQAVVPASPRARRRRRRRRRAVVMPRPRAVPKRFVAMPRCPSACPCSLLPPLIPLPFPRAACVRVSSVTVLSEPCRGI